MAFAALLLAVAIPRPMEIVFVRHAETVANATGRYNSRTIDAFSEQGKREVAALTKQLNGMQFSAIIVSPSPRALNTIAPYLRAHHLKAEVWPELYECCDANTKKVKGPASPRVLYGESVRLPADLAPLFILRQDNSRFILAPSYEDGLRQIRLAADHLRRSFGGTGKTVLVVGHSLHGGRMIELLEGKPMVGKIRPENAKIMPFREQPDGKFAPIHRGRDIPVAAPAQPEPVRSFAPAGAGGPPPRGQ
ncbi:MAG: histidine phosphatase family protein [Fimbriimonadales bacterium]